MRGRPHAIVLQILSLAALFLQTRAAALVPPSCDADPPAPQAVTAAIFAAGPEVCDLNGDGFVSAADLVAAAVASGPTPTPTPLLSRTGTATEIEGTPTPTVPPPATATATALPTKTPSPPPCPVGGAELVISIDNQSGVMPVSLMLSGERVGEDCAGEGLAASYDISLDCAGQDDTPCVRIARLAPGEWRHSIRVLEPPTGQVQHRTALLTAGDTPNRLMLSVFASVFTVTTTANMGDGSLRRRILDSEGATKPALIQFDPEVFPPGVPTTIQLDFALPNLIADAVTIDGTDSNGAIGNRIIDAGGRGISALSINGARNHLVGLRLQNNADNDRDLLNISGASADGNLIERVVIAGPGAADGIGIDQFAGKDFGDTANVIRSCEIHAVADKGVKITTGAYVRVEDSWVRGNAGGGIQATLGGHVAVSTSLVEESHGGSGQNGLAANADEGPASTGFSELVTRGNIVRGNGANGISIRGLSVADLRDDYLATNRSSGLRVFNDIGPPATAVVQGVSAVCNGVDGAVVANLSAADFGGGLLGSQGNNAFTQNNLRDGGSNLRNAVGLTVDAINNQWEHCGGGATCDAAEIANYDLADHGDHTSFLPAQAQRAQQPLITEVHPSKAREGDLLRIFGSGFNAIDGHFAEDNCADVAGRNRCVPLRGNCVRIGGESAPVVAVTPTMLVVRWPFTCLEPEPLTVTIDQGPTGATSDPFTVCINDGG